METCFVEDAYCAKAAARPPHSIWVIVGAIGVGNMKALLLAEYRRLEIADLPTPAAGAGAVLIRVGACGICGSDVHGYDGSSGRRIPPIVLGHEAAGRIVAVPARVVYKLPETISFAEAAMLEAAAVAIHAVSLAEISAQITALVVGAGTIGVLILQALLAAGCKRVFVSDVDASRLKLAKELGATDVLHADKDVVAHILQRTGGVGVDVAMEAVGRNETVNAAIASVRKGGTVVLVGNISPDVTLPLQKVVTRQIRLQGSCASAGEYPEAITLIASGAIRVKPLISAIVPLTEGPAWFERLYAREPNLLKVVLTPGSIS